MRGDIYDRSTTRSDQKPDTKTADPPVRQNSHAARLLQHQASKHKPAEERDRLRQRLERLHAFCKDNCAADSVIPQGRTPKIMFSEGARSYG
jgi:hypothetical protein